MGNPFEGWKIRHYINPYRNADTACMKGMKGHLSGNRIVLFPDSLYSKIQVHGLYTRDFSRVIVEFTKSSITVVKPKGEPR